MSLPETLKLTRPKLLMSQKTFAKEISVSVATINRWENEDLLVVLLVFDKGIGRLYNCGKREKHLM